MICENCGNNYSIIYGSGRFCSEKCARGFSSKEKRLEINKKVSIKLGGNGLVGYNNCLNCGKKIRIKNKFCNQKCQHNYSRSIFIGQVEKKKEFFNNNGKAIAGGGNKRVKNYLINKFGHRCSICGFTKWLNDLIPLTLDHVDGNSDNWKLENLRLICPNCDRLQPTYGSKNRGKGRSILRNQKRMSRYYRGVAPTG